MIDLLSPEFRRDPFAAYRMARAASPLLLEPRSGLWMVFDHASVKRVLLDTAQFSSCVVPPGGRAPAWLVFSDPPRHSRLRALIANAFTRRSIEELEPRVREFSRLLLEESLARGRMDYVADYALPLPVMVIAEMLGAPLTDVETLMRWSTAIVNLSYSLVGGRAAELAYAARADARAQMEAYVGSLVEQRRARPKDDLLTRLTLGEVDGERLSREDIVGFFELLLAAATETSTNLIANTLVCLLEAPHERARIERDLRLVPAAIEEVVRYRSPLQMLFRQTRHEVVLHGRGIPADTLLVAMVGSANRDAAVFSDADRFDCARDPNPHLGFGHGIHYCIGATLARMEARVALEDLLCRMGDVVMDPNQAWEPREALHVHGPKRLDIRFTAARPACERVTVRAACAASAPARR